MDFKHKSNNNKLALAFVGLALGIGGLLLAVSDGAKAIPLQTVLNSIFHYQEELDMQLVRDIRIPRAIASAMVGGILGICGAMMQGVTRNPIAEPSLMGITQGAMLAIALLYAAPGLFGLAGNTVAALIGSAISGGLVLFFSMKNARSLNVTKLLLAGTALSTFFISLATVISLLTNQSQNLAFWVAGGLRSVTWKEANLVSLTAIIGILLAMLLSKRINIVNLGEDVAVGLGENPGKVRIMTLLLTIPMCAVAVSISGSIAFVGLIVPHALRKVIGVDYRFLLPFSALFGAVLLIWADVLARLINQPYETPVGLFTSLLGVPFFLWMVRRERR